MLAFENSLMISDTNLRIRTDNIWIYTDAGKRVLAGYGDEIIIKF